MTKKYGCPKSYSKEHCFMPYGKDKMQYDWEYDINQEIETIKTEVESWLKN